LLRLEWIRGDKFLRLESPDVMNFYTLLLVGGGGFLGSIARYLTVRSVDEKLNALIPYGTLTVNILGSFLIGLLYGWLSRREGGESIRLLLGTGFCGGFTTYSAFALENVTLWQQKLLTPSLLYILATLILGFLVVAAGIFIARSIS
jgi:CrcB protein